MIDKYASTIEEFRQLEQDLREHVFKLRTAIRKHRDEKGSNRDLDDQELYSVLPESPRRP